MNEKKDSTNNIKDLEEEFIEAVAEKALDILVERGLLTPCIDCRWGSQVPYN